MSFNVPSELILVDHGTTTEEAATRADQGKGKRGKGGDSKHTNGRPHIPLDLLSKPGLIDILCRPLAQHHGNLSWGVLTEVSIMM